MTNSKYAMTATEVMEVIPNRYPIMFIDYVDEISENKILATKNVTINEEVFNGHFLRTQLSQAVLILESLAQAGSILILKKKNSKEKWPILVASTKLNSVKKLFL